MLQDTGVPSYVRTMDREVDFFVRAPFLGVGLCVAGLMLMLKVLIQRFQIGVSNSQSDRFAVVRIGSDRSVVVRLDLFVQQRFGSICISISIFHAIEICMVSTCKYLRTSTLLVHCPSSCWQ